MRIRGTEGSSMGTDRLERALFPLPALSSISLDLELRGDPVTLEDNDWQDGLWSASSGGLGKLRAHSVLPSVRWNVNCTASVGAADISHPVQGDARKMSHACHRETGRARGCCSPALSQARLLASLEAEGVAGEISS